MIYHDFIAENDGYPLQILKNCLLRLGFLGFADDPGRCFQLFGNEDFAYNIYWHCSSHSCIIMVLQVYPHYLKSDHYEFLLHELSTQKSDIYESTRFELAHDGALAEGSSHDVMLGRVSAALGFTSLHRCTLCFVGLWLYMGNEDQQSRTLQAIPANSRCIIYIICHIYLNLYIYIYTFINLNFQSGHNFSPRPYPSLQKGLGKKKAWGSQNTWDCWLRGITSQRRKPGNLDQNLLRQKKQLRAKKSKCRNFSPDRKYRNRKFYS